MSTTEGRIRLSLDSSSLAAGVAKSKDALAGMDAVARRVGPALGDMSKTAKGAAIGTDLLTGGILGAVKGLGPYGLALGVAADVLISYEANATAAAKAARELLEVTQLKTKAFQDDARETANHSTFVDRDAAAIKRATGETDDKVRAMELEIARTKGLGQETHELEKQANQLRVTSLLAAADLDLYLESAADAALRRAELYGKAADILREQELKDAEHEGKMEKESVTQIVVKRRTGGRSKPQERADNSFADKAAVAEWEKLMEAREEQRKAKREQDERDFQNFDDRFAAIRSRRAEEESAQHEANIARVRAQRDLGDIEDARLQELGQERIDRQFNFDSQLQSSDQQVEQSRQLRHENEMARIEEEQRAREEQLAMQQRIVDAAAGYAGQAVAGLLSISDARKQARAAALAQGKSEAEAARAAKAAELQARAAAMIGIRNMAATKAAEHLALGIGALATTWGIPNPSAALHFAAAGMFGVLAGASAARAQTLGDRAAGMEGGGGFGGAGFGQPSAGAAGSGAANGPPQPAGAGNQIPGSPVPQPTQQSQSSSGGTVVHIHGNVIGNRQFVDDIARQLDEREHRRPRRAMGGG